MKKFSLRKNILAFGLTAAMVLGVNSFPAYCVEEIVDSTSADTGAAADSSSARVIRNIVVSAAKTAAAADRVETAAENKNAAAAAEQVVETITEQAANTGNRIAGSFGILQNEKYDNLDETPVLSGGEVRFLNNTGSAAQQLSAVFKSNDGKVIVVDGGQQEDVDHLVKTVREMGGGKVDAWLVTHPHTDHVGALNGILKSGRSDITIGSVYYNMFDQSWYNANDPDEAGTALTLRENLKKLPADRLHPNAGKGTSVQLSENMSFRVLNDPVQSTGVFAGNSAGLLYDVVVNGKHFLLTGDMGEAVGNQLLEAGALDELVCDFVQMSHHGQNGVNEAFYKKVNPKYCVWPSSAYVYNAKGATESGLKTTLTKLWISKLPVRGNYVTLGRDVILR